MLKTPYEDLLPGLSTAENEALAADLKANGQLEKVLIDHEDAILDGHHRYRILGRKTQTKVLAGSKSMPEAERRAYALRVNLNRRQLSPSQQAEIDRRVLVPLANELRWGSDWKAARKNGKPKPERSEAAVGKLLGRPQQTIARWTDATPTHAGKCSKPPSYQVTAKIKPAERAAVLERVEAGETQAKVAAEYKVSRQLIGRIAKSEQKRRDQHEQREALAAGTEPCNVMHGTVKTAGKDVPDSSVDFILTDPPYDEEATKLYVDLAKFAARVLKPGGWCLAYSGQVHLPIVLSGMQKHLTYAWTFAVIHTGGDLRFRKYKLHNKWKPVVGFYREPLDAWWPDWLADTVSGGKEKDDHKWQQALSEAEHFVSGLCPAGGMVCDPFCGSGTVLLAAKNYGMRWLGIDSDEEAVQSSMIRLA